MDISAQRRDQLHIAAVESIAAQMMNSTREMRINGGNHITEALQRGDYSAVVAQIAAHLQERPDQQEREAVHALTKRLGIGRIEATDAICDKLWDSESLLRRASLEALARVAERGDSVSVETLVAHSEDDDPHVRKTVVEGLGKVASPGDTLALETVLTRLEDVNGFVREASAKALASLGVCPDQDIREAVSGALIERLNHDQDWAVKDAAADTQSKLQQYAQRLGSKRGSRVSFGDAGTAGFQPSSPDKSQAVEAGES